MYYLVYRPTNATICKAESRVNLEMVLQEMKNKTDWAITFQSN